MSVDRKNRGRTPKRRKFHGNRFTKRENEESFDLDFDPDKSSSCVCVDRSSSSVDNNDTPPSATPTFTMSERKLGDFYDIPEVSQSKESDDSSSVDNDSDGVYETDDYDLGELHGNRIIDADILSAKVSASTVCRFCHGELDFIEVSRKGLASEFAFHCNNKHCNQQTSFHSCEQIPVGSLSVSSINRRSVFAMRCVGGDHAELATFCAMMDQPPPVQEKSVNIINKKTILKACTTVQKASCKKAAQTEHKLAQGEEGDPCRDVDVSSDGTWMTPGHSSMIGLVTTVGCTTGKVLDVEVKSKSCKSCDYWSKQDKTSDAFRQWELTHVCNVTHEGSSGSMEAEATKTIFERSVNDHKLRYTRFIGDGDTNTYKKVADAKVYGDSHPVEKIECVGHVHKRMGTRLRNLKKSLKGQKLSDGKPISGKGRLTDKHIDLLQSYYRTAIVSNKHNLQGMRQAVWATFFHRSASDEMSRAEQDRSHAMCDISWCKYKKAAASHTLHTYKNTNSLPMAVMEVIKPIFQDLSNPSLLSKCLDGYTQNANECVNSVVWKYCPKKKYHGVTVVKVAAAMAVSVFNDGAQSHLDIMIAMELSVGKFASDFCEQKDSRRIKNAKKQAKDASHEARIAKRRKRKAVDEEQAELEGQPYVAGGY